MTRSIKDIYNDLDELTEGAWLFRGKIFEFIDNTEFNYHTGNSQIVPNELLVEMFNKVMELVHSRTLDSNSEPYSIGEKWVYDTGWWSKTSEQNTEIDNLRRGNYYTPYSQYTSQEFFIDENNSYKQANYMGSYYFNKRPIFYNNSVIDVPLFFAGNGGDKIRYSDLTEFDNGFFDPAYVMIETQTQLNLWLDGLDSIITRIKEMTNPSIINSMNLQNTTGSRKCDDVLESLIENELISYSYYPEDADWDDPNLMPDYSGTIVRSHIEGNNQTKVSGIGTPTTVWSRNVFSKEVEYSYFTGDYDPETGWPIYYTATHRTETTSSNGMDVIFGMTLPEVHVITADIANNNEFVKQTKNATYFRQSLEDADQTFDTVEYDSEGEIIVEDEVTVLSGELIRNAGLNYYKKEDLLYNYGTYQNAVPDYAIGYYTRKTVGTVENWEGEVTHIIDDPVKYTDVIGQIEGSETSEGQIDNLPEADTNTEVTGAVTISMDEFRTFIGLDNSQFTIKTIAPPE